MISLWIYMQRLGIGRLVRMRSENEGKMLYIGDTDFASTALTVVYKNRMRRVIKNRMHNWLTYTSISDSSPENFRAFHSPHFRLPLKERSASRTEFSKTSLAANSIDRQKYVGVCNCKYTWKTLPSFSVFTIPALAALMIMMNIGEKPPKARRFFCNKHSLHNEKNWLESFVKGMIIQLIVFVSTMLERCKKTGWIPFSKKSKIHF